MTSRQSTQRVSTCTSLIPGHVPLTQVLYEHQLKTENQLDTFEVMSIRYISTARLEELRMHSAQDQVLQTLTTVIQCGWPEKECMLPLPIRAFFPYRDELATEDGTVVNGHRAVISHSLQQGYVNILHRGHPGIESTNCRATMTSGLRWTKTS